MKNPEPGEVWKHSKSGTYSVVCIATDEKTKQEMVVYRDTQTEKIWSRPLKGTIGAWMTTVNGVPRFKRVEL